MVQWLASGLRQRLSAVTQPNAARCDASRLVLEGRASGQSRPSRVRVHHPAWTGESLDALKASRARLRVRGWLMLDQMHPEKVERNRRTLWEVHPVMQLDWQRADSTWVSLDSLVPPVVRR